ncbi:MAG TPA: ABC transporter permease [Pyrinomonadaceae bacterium]|nr:ABC transporter permease [Pyrinomonadaceae bacterium]
MDSVLKDIRYSLRGFIKRPAFSAIALITLALGIGANSAIFSVVNSIVLRPLPYQDSSRLMVLWGNLGSNALAETELSAPEFVDVQQQCQSFDGVAAYTTQGFNLSGLDQPERLRGALVSASLFSTLKVQPSLGRTFLQEEDRYEHDRVVVLSHALWQRRFGGDASILNRTITLDGQPVIIVGVMPASFQFPEKDTELWRPLALSPDLLTENNRGSHFLNVVARLRANIDPTQAQAELNTVTARMSVDHKTTYPRGFSLAVKSLQEDKVGANLRKALFILLGAVGLVLAVACANVAHLLLANAAGRHRETAVRAALGASRGRIVRQFLTESLLLSGIGGVAGLLVAFWGVRLLVALIPKDTPRIEEIALDYRVVIFTLGISLLTGILFGLFPALQASKTDLNEALKEAGRGGVDGPRRLRLRNALVVSEFALALVLLIGAGLLMKSFQRLQVVNPGFQPAKLLTMRLALPESKYDKLASSRAFFEQLFQRVEVHSEVESIGAINVLPFSGSGGDRSFTIEGREVPEGQPRPDEQVRFVSVGYFKTMEIPLLKGRDLTNQDVAGSTPVVIINQAMGRKFWPDGDALGKRIFFSRREPKMYEIVGIVGNVKHRGLDLEDKPEFYIPALQPLFADANIPPMYLVVRTKGEPDSVTALLRNEVSSIDPEQALSNVLTMEQRISESVAPRRFNMFLLALFAGLALLLASVGIYGIMTFSVTQRTHEIGVRIALGARSADVFRMVLRNGFTLALIGVALGLALAFATTRVLSSLLFGVSATDPWIFVIDALLLIAVSLVACYVPARRATRVNPLEALRYE